MGKQKQSNGDRSSFPHYTQHKFTIFYRDIWPLRLLIGKSTAITLLFPEGIFSFITQSTGVLKRCFAVSSSATTQETPAYQCTTQGAEFPSSANIHITKMQGTLVLIHCTLTSQSVTDERKATPTLVYWKSNLHIFWHKMPCRNFPFKQISDM